MKHRACYTATWLILLAFTFVAAASTGFSVSLLIRRGSYFFDIAAAMVPPSWSYVPVVVAPLWATIRMSLAGTALGALLGLVLAVAANAYVNPWPFFRLPLKGLIHLVRTIPALILALLCTFLVGIGTLAGTLALFLYTTAVMARIGYEDMENADLTATRALAAAGCGRLKACVRTVLPAVLSGYLTNVLYLLEANVRHAAILGFVGAGGIGLLLNERLAWREYADVGAILLLLYVVVIVTEGLSEWLRRVLDGTCRLGRAGRFCTGLSLALLVLISLTALRLPEAGQTSQAAAGALVSGLLQPDWSLLLATDHTGVAYLLYETFCIAFLGTLGGLVIAAFFSFIASFRLAPWVLSVPSRLVLLLIRTVPVFVYGLMWIRVTGPGPFAGVLTLTLCSVGLLAKHFLIAINDIDRRPYGALLALGSSRPAALVRAIVPQLGPRYAAAVLYRLDVNLRDAAILGLVGAGGIGTPLILAMMHYDWHAASSLLWGLIALVTVVEMASEWLRKVRRF